MGKTILIVDDSATTRAIIKRTIQMCGIEGATILEAGNGKEGLAAVAKAMNRIDLVLADLHMPEMDGAEMTRRLCADPATKHVPVVICSAEPNAAKIESLMQSGAKGHLRKPFTPEGIRKAITAVLEVARAA